MVVEVVSEQCVVAGMHLAGVFEQVFEQGKLSRIPS